MPSGPHNGRNRPASNGRPADKPASRVRIVVADPQTLDRFGLIGLLKTQSDFDIVGEGTTIEDTIECCRAQSPDVLLLALSLRGEQDVPPMAAIRRALPELHVLAMAERGATTCLVLNPPGRLRMPGEPPRPCEGGNDCLQLAATEGALGTLRRTVEPEELFQALRAVATGRAWYEPRTADALRSGAQRLGEELSDREREVAELLARGLSNKEISTKLDISEPTVKKHVGKLLDKLGLQDRLQAGLFVARHPLMLRGNGRQETAGE